MNKLYKFLIAGIFTIIGLCSFCNAGEYTLTGTIATSNKVYSYTDLIYFSVPLKHYYEIGNTDLTCTFNNLIGYTDIPISLSYIYVNSNGTNSFYGQDYHITENSTATFNYRGLNQNAIIGYIFRPNTTIDNVFSFDFSCTVSGDNVIDLGGNTCDYSDYITQEQCNEQYSGYIEKSTINSEYCLNNNLCYSCPTINKGYCKSEYNLIEPSECPICEGSGSINWSSLYINGTQYNSNEIIDIHTEKQMETSIEYSNTVADIDISYGQDEEYLDNVISYTQMTPTNDDLAMMLSNGLQTYAPYLFIGLLLIFTIALIKKFFRG